MDETWVHHYSQKPNSSGSSGRKRSITFAGKVMACVFRDAKWILLIDYLEKAEILQDNAPAHTSVLAMGKLWDLAPSYFHLFPHLKKFISEKRFASNEEHSRLIIFGKNSDIGETGPNEIIVKRAFIAARNHFAKPVPYSKNRPLD
ncbi:hypothetical protein LAZ67_9001039, partial [Cordylochernes scorpioides]